MATGGKTTLGLDLGSNSIGWALIDESSSRIIATGVRIFPEGVARDTKGGELSKNESRRIARGMRRQIARRSRRKKRLREALVLSGLLPAGKNEQAQLDVLNPYELRRRALTEKLAPYEFGRLLVHLNQRRGFLSNRKSDKGKQKEDSETLEEINDLELAINEQGHATLGEHLASLYAANPLARLRGKHTRRGMYEREFEAIWTAQAKHCPDLLTDALKFGRRGRQTYPRKPERLGNDAQSVLAEVGLFGLIFFQRPMYWPTWVVGQCEINPKQKRCPRADRIAQRIRIFQEVNNLKIILGDGEIVEPTLEQRSKLIKLLSEKAEVKFEEIRKKLGLLENDGFTLEFGGRTKLLGMETDAILAKKNCMGKDWHSFPEDRKNEIVRSLIHDDERTFLEKNAQLGWGFDAETADKLLRANLPDGYASYSRETIERLLPHVEAGLPLLSRDGSPCAVRLAGFLPPWERPIKGGQFLPPPPDITNPLVRQALYDLRKLINAIIREYGKPSAIHIELAREIKGNAKKRAQISQEMRDREVQRDQVRKRLEAEHPDIKPTRATINRYLLWKEQSGMCMYSGREIGLRQLFSGEIDVDHILPYSKSLDDGLMNKAVCFRSENHDKGQRTVHEWLAATNPDKYEKILQRAAKLPIDIRNRKRPKFSQSSCELKDFIQRQLNDTAYITSAVVDYMKLLGIQVVGSKGQLTAELRHQWGLNEVLSTEGLNVKNREDHRHHAVDAIVIALTNHSRLQQLARQRGESPLTLPWENLRPDVKTAVNAINVSFHVNRKISGCLHNEKPFGRVADEGGKSDERQYVQRRPIAAIDNTKKLKKVRDNTIRSILTAHIAKHGIDIERPSQIPDSVWKEIPCMPSGIPILKVRMIEQGESYHEVRQNFFVELANNHHYEIYDIIDESGNPVLNKDGTTKRCGQLISSLEAAKRITSAQKHFMQKRRELLALGLEPLEFRRRLAIQQSAISREFSPVERNGTPKRKFVMSLAANELILLECDDGPPSLHRVQKMSEGSIILRPHTYAGKVSDRDKPPIIQRRTPNSLRGRKVTVDLLGRIRWAND